MTEHRTTYTAWRKSSRSGSSGGECVEVARVGAVTVVRDSKNPAVGHLGFTSTEWDAFLTKIKRGEYTA